MNKSIFLSLFLLFSSLIFAQETKIIGVIVQDTDEQAIQDVNLTIEGTLISVKTNAKGEFHLIILIYL